MEKYRDGESGNTTVLAAMYHYVRDLRIGLHCKLKGCDIRKFRDQVRWLKDHYVIVSGQQILDAVAGRTPLPPNAAALTFDDGYREHFDWVMPVLDELRLPGIFFPPGRAIKEHRMLEANKIHFILAACDRPDEIVGHMRQWIGERQSEDPALPSFETLWQGFPRALRFDPPEVLFIKYCLQRALPQAARDELTDLLFRRYVSTDEKGFANELYLSMDQLRMMHRHGMYIGSHSYSHQWLDLLTPDEFAEDVERSVAFMEEIAGPRQEWMMCYPYGCNPHPVAMDALVETLKRYGCIMGWTDHGGQADLSRHHPFMLPREDTNDIPHA